jgi:HSP20 family protein
MKLVPYSRNYEFKPMTSMMNLFDDFFNRFYEDEQDNSFKAMAMDIVEHEKEFELLANLPGFRKDEVKISVHDNQLVIEAKCENKQEEKQGTMYRCERYNGSYKRALYLPENADAAKIQAKMEDGVLKLSVPKQEATPQKEIVIE